MFNSKTAKQLKEYGNNMIAVVWCVKNSQFEDLAIVQCNELCNLDGGREIYRGHKSTPIPKLKIPQLMMDDLNVQLIYTTPNCKEIADKVAKRYNPCPVQLLFT